MATVKISNILDYMREYAPTTYTVLHRPITGQGGFQSSLRRVQAELGITPNVEALHVTPASRTVLHTTEAEPAPAQNPGKGGKIAPSMDLRAMVLQAASQLVAVGKVDDAKRLLAQLETVNGTDDGADSTDEESITGERGLKVIARKAKAAREAKATLKAQGRTRRSPRLTEDEREARSKRMKAMWRKARKASR